MTDKELKIWDECLIYLHNLMIKSPEHGNAMMDILNNSCFVYDGIFDKLFNDAYFNAHKECVQKITEFEIIDKEHRDIMEFQLERFNDNDIIGICKAKKLVKFNN